MDQHIKFLGLMAQFQAYKYISIHKKIEKVSHYTKVVWY